MHDIVWPGGRLALTERTHVMAVLNVTPDSFSDGGEFFDVADAVEQGIKLAADGAHILDVGGESTRPGAEPVDAAEEIRRVVPVIEGIAKTVEVPISVDTAKSEVARAALEAGASIINDVSAGTLDPEILALAARAEVPVVLMHMRGKPRTMQEHPVYGDVVTEVRTYLLERAAAAENTGVDPRRIVIDPGFGFGKTRDHNLMLLQRLGELVDSPYPVLAGTSRKSFIGTTLDLPVSERLEGTMATVALAVAAGARIVRVHDVLALSRVVRMVDAVKSVREG